MKSQIELHTEARDEARKFGLDGRTREGKQFIKSYISDTIAKRMETKTPKAAKPEVDDVSLDHLFLEGGGCLCGCGQPPMGTKSVFIQGHDMKLKSKIKHGLEISKGARQYAKVMWGLV